MPDRWLFSRQPGIGDEIMKWGCVLLKGGRGSRMGYRDKSELIWRGQTFGFRIRQELEQLGIPCFLSEAEKSSPSEDAGNKMALWSPVLDQIQQAGPMGGIGSCLKACLLKDSSMEGLFFVSCDLPFFRKEMAVRLAAAFKEGDDGVMWRTRDGRLHPVCAFYAKSALPVIESCLNEGEFRMRTLCSRLRMRILDTEKEHIPDTWFMNINRPEAYEALGDRKRPAVLAVGGSKNTGKTTLTEALVRELSKRTVDYSEKRFCVVKEETKQAEDFIACFSEADLILLEGQKHSSYPKLETMRRVISTEPVCRQETVLAYVTDFGGGGIQGKWDETPVYPFQDMDRILELVIKVMDGYKG